MSNERYYPGLEGVIAGETAVSTVEGGLTCRGYKSGELARHGSFLEVAYLLLYDDLPSQEELADFQSVLSESEDVDSSILEFLAHIPLHVPAMDVLRTGVSALAHFDPQLADEGVDANRAKAIRLLARIPVLIGARHRSAHGLPLVDPNPELSFSGNLLYLITGKDPTPSHEQAMDISLILYAEHEFNASTFTARVVASTQSDIYSAITAAIGALKGPLHGGANERAIEVLQEAP